LIEFEMTDSEIAVAQECAGGNRYRILLITSILEPENREVFELPSPLSTQGRGRFRGRGSGRRYQCAPRDDSLDAAPLSA